MAKLIAAYEESLKESLDIKKWKTQNNHRVVNFDDLGEIKRTGLTPE
jgi:hypothetical protein